MKPHASQILHHRSRTWQRTYLSFVHTSVHNHAQWQGTYLGFVHTSRSKVKSSRSYFTTDGQSVCRGVEPTLGLMTRYYFLSECCCLKSAALFQWSALCDERTGVCSLQ
jgi:hypothetical protein